MIFQQGSTQTNCLKTESENVAFLEISDIFMQTCALNIYNSIGQFSERTQKVPKSLIHLLTEIDPGH